MVKKGAAFFFWASAGYRRIFLQVALVPSPPGGWVARVGGGSRRRAGRLEPRRISPHTHRASNVSTPTHTHTHRSRVCSGLSAHRSQRQQSSPPPSPPPSSRRVCGHASSHGASSPISATPPLKLEPATSPFSAASARVCVRVCFASGWFASGCARWQPVAQPPRSMAEPRAPFASQLQPACAPRVFARACVCVRVCLKKSVQLCACVCARFFRLSF